jgi:cytochrome c-type biogenesis protein CcmH/NrfF
VSRLLSIAALTAILCATQAAFAQDMDQSRAPDPNLAGRIMGLDPNRIASTTAEQAEQAKQIGQDVVCLCGTCPKHTITECECGWAGAGKRTIQQAVAQGKTREEIVAAYRKAYGDQVLAMLPDEGFAHAAWVFPWVAGIVGLALVFVVGLRYLRRGASEHAAGAAPVAPVMEQASASRAALEKELEDLD